MTRSVSWPWPKTKILPVLVILTAVSPLLMACNAPPPETSPDKAKSGHGAETAAPQPSAEGEDEGEGGGTAPDVNALLPYEELQISLADKGVLYGRLYDPSQKPESETEESGSEEDPPPTEKYPLVILLHALNGSHQDWGQLPARLVSKGYAVLAVDLRGHGKSVVKNESWRTFSAGRWKKLPVDVGRMIDFFNWPAGDVGDYPQVDSGRVALVGASIGANMAIIAGSQDNRRIRAIVTLSAGLDYKGIETTKPIYQYHNPLLMVASQDDAYAFDSTDMLYRLASGKKSLQLYRKIGHGTDMIRFFPELQTQIVDWLAAEFPPAPLPIVYPPEEEESETGEEG